MKIFNKITKKVQIFQNLSCHESNHHQHCLDQHSLLNYHGATFFQQLIMFALVVFSATKDVAVIPRNWLNLEKDETNWPPYKGFRLKRSVELSEVPKSDWKKFSVRVLMETGKYEIQKIKNSIVTYAIVVLPVCIKKLILVNFVKPINNMLLQSKFTNLQQPSRRQEENCKNQRRRLILTRQIWMKLQGSAG